MGFILLSTILFSSILPAQTPKKVAVFEYRSGVSEQSDFTARVTSLLRYKSNVNVVSIDDARRKLGSKFDMMVSKCKSNPYCVSQIGRKLKVDEVILVALTEFGAVLINVSRIIVKKATTSGSTDISVNVGGNITKLQIYRVLTKIFPKSYFKRTGILKITSNIKGAKVLLNNKNSGTTPISPMKLPAPRHYKIHVSKLGYIPFRASVDLVPRGSLTIQALLSPEGQPVQEKWYKKWWVWTLAGTALSVVFISSYYFTRPPESVPAMVKIH